MCDWLPRVKASSVTMDTQDAIWKCLQHLEQQGRKNIKFLAVDYASKTLEEREEAFKAGLAQLGLNVSADSVVYTELAKLDSICRVMRQIAQGPDRPDALVCVSDAVALSALSECARLDVRIPGDLAVTGLGNLEFTDHPFFSLTTVDECRKEIGKQAAQLVLRQISQDQVRPAKPEHIRIKSPLIIRKSTGGLLVEA
jgi:DNA-binding LacI/PurR family transcriptional regulator